MQATEVKNKLSEDQTNKVMLWASMTHAFTLDMLTGQIQRLRCFSADSAEAAKAQIQQWKRTGKIKFSRGYWKWQF
jgi:hypothetical protein